jgi:small subunit ribosomal protein S1
MGKVINVTKYGAFIELEKGVEGLVHISEMSWTKHIEHPNQMLKVGDEIEVIVLNIDQDNQKISLGIKQLEVDPWEIIDQKYPVNQKVNGKVRSLTSFGVFVELEEGIDGLIHISDLSWTKSIMHPSEILHKGQEVEVIVLDIDKEKHRISLGFKQLSSDPWPMLSQAYALGSETKGKVVRMTDRGVTVMLPDDIEGFVPITQLAKEVNKPVEAFEIGEDLPLKVIEFDPSDHRVVLSVTA